MKKRLISAALCLLMLVTSIATASCGKEEVDPNTLEIDGATARAMTLTIWGIKGAGTTDEAVAAVEAAMSSITEAQFNTAIKLELYSEKDYDKALEKKMDEIQAQLDLEAAEAEAKKQAEKEAKKNKTETTKAPETSAEETTEIADETILDEYGLPATLYPEVEDTQLDIFLMTDYDMLLKYQEKGVLSALDEQLSSSSKLLKSYIHPTFLSAGKVGGSTVAIINNQPIGEYTFMLMNKSLMDKYYYDPENFISFNDAYDFINDVGREEKSYTPFMGDISPVGVNYFTLDGTKTVVGNMLAPGAVYGDPGEPAVLFANKTWTTYTSNVAKLKKNGYIGAETVKETDKFGVAIIKGGYEDVAAFEEDYYINVLQAPQGTTENIYNGMFAVSTYTKSLARAMEIVTYLNTRSDLRNLFAYGIQDVHYTLDKDDVLTKISKDYNMELAYTGNMFVAHAPEGEPADYWESFKQQNLDAVLSPYFGFEYTEDMIDTTILKGVIDFSNRFYNALNTADTAAMDDFMMDWWDQSDLETSIANWIATDLEDNEKTIGKVYADWYAKVGK